ncbi:pyruvate formate lyase-activating enzyme 1 [Escherichia coli KO11FL]|nr:pyruvate formate lyase-activating enzyme 1 [Escherichia coli KO11FL]AFH18624.1 pyruvate formate lyase-activating enzyme 1 [Escherichia coli KO11FL]AFH18632.1 pyruvate formate lyase-activating enzyme 1 [Escherichia coli KO11FL]AFH18640.1 pyruvate formate lyase-activating enzyme 1 [Escherichia coli KO11FL]AFH18648.1 pyruvate formate lyase-activating enzyme 1 [Escherichia coli KO11FL]
MSVIGRIHSFESCGTVDGPGIRFITFFQGCLMRCLYCHNRDTWDTHGGKEVTVEDLMKEVVTYRHFMNASGGGVTASGGEAILQAEFVRDWFRACKKEGIHTCLDTNGFVRRYDPVIDELLEVTDLVMLDLKQMNDEIHQNLVGVSNHRTLEFAKYLANKNVKVWIGRRSPLCDSCIRKQPSSRLRPLSTAAARNGACKEMAPNSPPATGPATIPTPKQALMSPKWRARSSPSVMSAI